jgi:flagellar hook-basal body complex protein FliE
MVPIVPVHLTAPPAIAPVTPPSIPGLESTGGETFSSIFANAVQKVEGYQQDADASVDKFLSGEGEELHTVALKTQQAQISFDLFMQVRNKVVSAYQEIMRMQV